MDLRWHFKPAGAQMQSTKKVEHFTHSKQQHHLGMLVFLIFTPFQGVWKKEIRWACQTFISVEDWLGGMDLRWHFKPTCAQMQSTKKVGHFTHSKQQHHLGMLVFLTFTTFQGVRKEEIRWARQTFISVEDWLGGMDLRWHFKPAGAQMQNTKKWDILHTESSSTTSSC